MQITLLIFIIVAAIVSRLPIVGKYFSIINTLIHEIGHALMAIITGGKVDKIQLFANTEGTAWTSNRFWLGRVLTSAAGYVFSSFIAFAFLYSISIERFEYCIPIEKLGYCISIERYELILYTLVVFLVIGLLFWIRNLYGFFWMISFTAGFAYLIWKGNDVVTEYVLLFITATILVQSIYSAWEILYLSFKSPSDAGDATNLAKSTFIIPAQVWGIFFFLQSLYFGWLGLSLFLR
ncbi:M50 family metallopeptidase [Viridibacillus arvi]|uniref:M50 family metallopeptidase n=1 Tax=Viridibacillus arvi TaxID=263475 RepID=UPI0034CD916A